MPKPPKAPPIMVGTVTHHSIDLNWEPYYKKLNDILTEADGKLRVEVQCRKKEGHWDVVYKGFDVRCTCANLDDNEDYSVRFCFGNAHGWGDFCEAVKVQTHRKPYTGEDIHRFLRRQNEYDLRKVLEKHEANINAPNDQGFSPLMMACQSGNLSFCELLLEFGADVNWTGENGKSCLMMCCYKGKPEIVEFLIDNNANVNLKDKKGMTPLHYAVDGEQTETIKLLLDRGADIHSKDSANCTPLIRCAMLKNNGNAMVTRTLIKHGAHLDEMDSSGQNAVFYCALNRHEKMLEVLLESGANPTSCNEKGTNAMAIAEAQERKQMRNLLQDYTVKWNSRQST